MPQKKLWFTTHLLILGIALGWTTIAKAQDFPLSNQHHLVFSAQKDTICIDTLSLIPMRSASSIAAWTILFASPSVRAIFYPPNSYVAAIEYGPNINPGSRPLQHCIDKNHAERY